MELVKKGRKLISYAYWDDELIQIRWKVKFLKGWEDNEGYDTWQLTGKRGVVVGVTHDNLTIKIIGTEDEDDYVDLRPYDVDMIEIES